MTDKPTCRTCRYWHDHQGFVFKDPRGDYETGECRIRSESFPHRKSTDWCGEHPQFKEKVNE